MKATLLPILTTMRDFYTQPRSMERFQDYLDRLHAGRPGQLSLPISGFNPMAKDHILPKLQQLLDLDAETIASDTLATLAPALQKAGDPPLQVVINLLDDAGGGWTNRHTSEFQMTFEIQALAKHHFSTPMLWTSEDYSPDLIRQRTQEAVLRTCYRLPHPTKLDTLDAHIRQEQFVAAHLGPASTLTPTERATLAAYHATHANSQDHSRIFNFFFGDSASTSLGYPCYGIAQHRAGFDYVQP